MPEKSITEHNNKAIKQTFFRLYFHVCASPFIDKLSPTEIIQAHE